MPPNYQVANIFFADVSEQKFKWTHGKVSNYADPESERDKTQATVSELDKNSLPEGSGGMPTKTSGRLLRKKRNSEIILDSSNNV